MLEVLKNEELNTIIHCISAGIGDDFDLKKIKYDKVIIMSDADVDGSHIQCLLITFFYRYMKPFIEEGHLYVAKPPLYKLNKGNKIEYAYNDNDLIKKQKKMGKCSLQRYKGYRVLGPYLFFHLSVGSLQKMANEGNLNKEYLVGRIH